MLKGVVPFPAADQKRWREKGYWQDKSLAQEFAALFARYADRVALIDGERRFTYRDIDRITDNLALNLLELGLQPLDRVVPTLPNVAEFVLLYVALQKIGGIPIAALVTHRFLEVNQFVNLSGATTCVYPERQGEFRFGPMVERVQQENPSLKFRIVLGAAGPGEHSLTELIERSAKIAKSELDRIAIHPTDPAMFQLSGGTTGI
ncbi:MAG: AMP-binding protein, partial [Burkholderiales bacterium]